jgi:hypothetical protein
MERCLALVLRTLGEGGCEAEGAATTLERCLACEAEGIATTLERCLACEAEGVATTLERETRRITVETSEPKHGKS